MNALTGWLIAVVGGAVTAWIAYPRAGALRLTPLLAALRALAAIAIIALLLDLPLGSAAPATPLVALDGSASWLRTGDSGTWRAALDAANAAAAGSDGLLLFGDSARAAGAAATPGDGASTVLPAIERSIAAGRPLFVVTDGALDDPDALQQASPGSRLMVLPVKEISDLAVADVRAPTEARAGDTITIQARVIAAAAPTAATTLRWTLDAASLAEVPVPALAAGGEAVVESKVVVPGGDSVAVLHAALASGSDRQPRNDSIAVALRRGVRQRVVVVSSAPDADVREVVTAVRRNSELPTDAYYRIAPGRWLREGSFSPIDEASVRAAVRGATLAVLHGDTAVLGAPRTLSARAMLLLAPPVEDGTDMLVRAAPASPLQAAMSGMVVESLPPLIVAAPARGGTTALAAAPGGGGVTSTPIMTVSDGAVRRVLLTAAGYNRWRTRGGVSEVAFQALIGSAADWLLAARGAASAPTPVTAVIRAGAPIRWRRGSQATSALQLRRDGDGRTRRDTLVFGGAGDSSASAETRIAPLAAGIWRGTVDGAPVVVPVSASAELLPQRSTLRSGPLGGIAVPQRRGARGFGWLYLASVLLLAVEWLLRRRAGLR